MTRRMGDGLVVLGVSAAGVAAAGAWVPFLRAGDSHLSVSTAHGLCSSTLGQFAQAASGRIQLDCTAVTIGYWGAILVGIAGLALIVVGIIRMNAERAERPPSGRDDRRDHARHHRANQRISAMHWAGVTIAVLAAMVIAVAAYKLTSATAPAGPPSGTVPAAALSAASPASPAPQQGYGGPEFQPSTVSSADHWYSPGQSGNPCRNLWASPAGVNGDGNYVYDCSSTGPSAATAVAPDAPSYDANGNIYPDPLCTQVGGTTIAGPTCSQIPYLGTDDQTYYTSAPINPDGTLQGPASTAGTGASKHECAAGYYPDGSAGPVSAAPGKWNAQLGLCRP